MIYELAVLKIYAEPLLFAIDKDCPEYLEAKRLLKFLDYFLPMSPDGIGQNSLSVNLSAVRVLMCKTWKKPCLAGLRENKKIRLAQIRKKVYS